MEGKKSLELHPGDGRELIPGVWEGRAPQQARLGWDGQEGQQGEGKGGFVPLSAGLVLPCLMKIRNLGRADFLPDLTPLICQRTELLQSSRGGEGGTEQGCSSSCRHSPGQGRLQPTASFFSPRKQRN